MLFASVSRAVFNVQGTLLELLCDAVDSCSRQGKGLVVCDFPRDLRWAEEFEAKVRKGSLSFAEPPM